MSDYSKFLDAVKKRKEEEKKRAENSEATATDRMLDLLTPDFTGTGLASPKTRFANDLRGTTGKMQNPYKPGTALSESFNWGQTGVATFPALSAQKQLASGVTPASINRDDVAKAAAWNAWNKYAEAYAHGEKWKPLELAETYMEQNAGQGFSPFGKKNRTSVDHRAVAIDNAETQQKNRATGRYDNASAIRAGDYHMVGDDYADMVMGQLTADMAALDSRIANYEYFSPHYVHNSASWYRNLQMGYEDGEPYSADDMYEFAIAMHPSMANEWSRETFGATGDPEVIGQISDEIQSWFSGDYEAAQSAEVDRLRTERAAMQTVYDGLASAKANRAAWTQYRKKYAAGNTSADYSSLGGYDDSGVKDILFHANVARDVRNMSGGDDALGQFIGLVGQSAVGRIYNPDTYATSGYDLLTDEEIDILNAAWNANHDPNEIMAMLDQTEGLSNRRMDVILNQEAEAADKYGLGYQLWNNTGVAVASKFAGARNFLYSLAGVDGINDPSSAYYDIFKRSEQGEAWQREQWETSMPIIGGYAHDILSQGAQQLTNLGLAALTSNVVGGAGAAAEAAGKAGQAAYNAATFLQSLGPSLQEGYERGYGALSNVYAPAMGVIEALTEKLPFDNMIKGSGTVGKTIAKGALTEPLEELASNAGGELAQRVMKGATGASTNYDDLYMDTYLATGSHELAQEAVAKARRDEAISTMIVSAGVGGLSATPAAIGVGVSQRKTGKAIANQGNAQSMINLAAQLPTGTEAHQLAVTLQEQTKNGGKISNAQLGRLFQATAAHLDEESKAVVSNTAADAIAEAMVAKGEDEESARAAAPVLAKQLLGEKLTPSDRKTLTATAYGLDMMEELNRRDGGGAVPEVNADEGRVAEMLVNEGSSRRTANMVAPAIAKMARGESLTRQEQNLVNNVPTAQAVIDKLGEEAGAHEWVQTATSKANEATIAGYRKQAQLAAMFKPGTAKSIGKAARAAESLVSKDHVAEGKKDMGVGVRGTDGKPSAAGEFMRFEVQDGVMKAVVKGADGKETMHNYTALEYKSRDIATIAAHAAQNSGGNAELANVMLQTYSGGDAQAHIGQMETAFRAGYDSSAVDAKTITRFSGDAKLAYQIGQKQAQAAETKRLENIGKVKLGKGSVSFEGGEMPSGLTKQQRNMVAATRAIAEATGINFTFFQSDVDSAGFYTSENGSYDGATNSIRLDLRSGKNYENHKAAYAILRTASHELTHFIEANSKENYSKLRQFISDELARKGQNFDALVQEKIDRSRAPLTRGGAIAEVVADGCEMMLKDSKAIQRLMQKDASLGEQLKNKLAEFVGRIRTAFKDINPASTEANALMDMRDGVLQYASELVELWDEGLVEAVENTRGATAPELRTPGKHIISPDSPAMDEITGGDDAYREAHPRAEQFAVRDLAKAMKLRMEVVSDGVQAAPFRLLDENGKEITEFTPEMMRNTPMGTLIDASVAAKTITEDVAKKQRKMFADLATLCAKYKDNNLVWELAGAELFSAIKNNSDKQYSTTVDFGTICAKTQAIIDVMSETMLEKKRGLTRKEVMEVYRATAGVGLSVPCPVCYVFSRWMGVPNLLNNMAKYQRRFDGMGAEEVTRFVENIERKYTPEKGSLSKAIGKKKTSLEKKIAGRSDKLRDAVIAGKDTSKLEKELAELEAEYADVEAYNWVSQVYCKYEMVNNSISHVRDENGLLVLNDNYRPVPEEILFDLRRTGEFAAYESSWRYRTTRGAGMGKAIMPYSGSAIGDSVYASQKRVKDADNAFVQQDLRKGASAILNAQKRAQRQNLIGGQRFQSTSDYRPEWGLDYLMTFLEMQAVGAKGQLYTKVIEAVDMFATANIEVNLSIMPKGKGYHTDANGNNVLGIEDFSPVTGIDFQQALEKTRKYDNVQMILVGISDEHIRLAMEDDRIGFIIPWHSSGSNSAQLAKLMEAVGEHIENGTDYEKVQSDKYNSKATPMQKRAREVRTNILMQGYADGVPSEDMDIIQGNPFLKRLYERFYVEGVDAEAYGVALTKDQAGQIFPHEYWDTSLTIDDADINGERFVEYCSTLGITPRFAKQFAGKKGYWKLLIDRRMYNRDGTYHHPKKIDVTNVKVGDVATSVSVAKYGDDALTMKARDRAIAAIDNAKATVPPPAFDGGVVQADRAKTQYSLRSPVTDTPAFREWFAGSKVVNEDGSPKLMYHGTNANDNFTVFDTYGSNFGLYGIGSYFTDDRSVAEGYTKKGMGKNPRIYEVYLNVQNPLDMDAAYQPEVWETGDKYIDAYFADAKTNADAFRALTEYCKDEEMDRWEGEEFITDHIMSKGFDGITHIGGGLYTKANPHLHRVYIVFEPDQIKSADPVTYDDEGNPIAMEDRFTSDADIRYSERTQAPATTRDYLLSMTDEDLHTDGEKDALARYRAMVDELSEKTMQLSQQQDLAQKETGDAKVAAQNRAEILAKQVDRLEAQIRGRERTNVFKPIMAEAKAIVEASRLVDAGATMEEAVKKVAGRMHADSERKISTLRGELRESKNTARKLGGRLDTAERRVENLRSKLVENEQQFRERLEKFRERVREEREVRESVAASRKRIVKMVKTLDKLRRQETDYKHVPEELKPVVNALVSAFAENSSMVFDSKRADRIAAAYAKLKELDNDLAAFYDDDIRESIEYIADLLAANRGKSMKPADYAVLENVVGNIYKMVRNGSNAFFEGQSVDFGMLADDIVDSMKGRDDFRTLRGTGDKVKWLDDHVRNGNMLPVYYFDNLGNDTLKRMGYDILRGQDQYGLWARQDHMTVGDLHKKYNYQAWAKEPTQEFTTKAGRKFQLTKEQALWVYATAKREASNELAATHHLDEGGFVFGKGEEQGKGQWETHNTTPIKLPAADVKTITDTLTAEQKAYADAVVKYLSTDIGARGNDVSMRMYGYRKYREQYYFPYRTASDQRQLTSVSGGVSATDDARLKHQSFTNPLKKGANTPLVLGSFTDIAVAHMNAMNTYAAMVIPVENLNRVLNRKTDMDGTMTTIRALMAQKYGESTRDYLTTLLTDLNGGVRNESRTGLDGMISAYKKGAVMASASVFLQQATSIARVGAVMDAKYLAKTTVQKRDWDELAKWSGVATIKDMGRFDVGVGKGAAQWIGSDADEFSTWQKARQMMKPNDWKTFKTRWDDALNFLPGWADRVTWCHIWNAVKAEQADLHNGMDTSSDAFMQLCAERFNDIINHTQVYDSTMTRSQMMRSKSGIDKMVTAFASEPTLVLNMLYDAISNPAHKGKRKKLIARTLAGVALSQVMAAAMQAVASAWRDDDDERTAMEKFLDKFGANVFENFNLFGMFPIIRDIYDTFTSNYEVERSDMALFSEMNRAMDKLLGGKLNAWQTVEEVGGVIAKFFGVPLKNVMRDLRAGYNAITSDWSAPRLSSLAYRAKETFSYGLYDSKRGAYYQRFAAAAARNDVQEMNDLKAYLTESKAVSEDSFAEGARKALKDIVLNGGMTEDAAIDILVNHGLADGPKDAFGKVMGWLKMDGETGGAYLKVRRAMSPFDGKALADAAAEMVKYGYTEKQVHKEIRAMAGDLYDDGLMSADRYDAIQAAYGGETDPNKLYWKRQELDYDGAGDFDKYNSLKQAMLGGNANKVAAAEKQLIDHGMDKKTVTTQKENIIEDMYKAGDITWSQAEKMLKSYTGMTDPDDLFWKQEEWNYTGPGKWTAYAPARNALLAGDRKTFLSEKSKLLTHGKEGKNVQSSAVTALKDELIDLYETDPAAADELRATLVWAYMECGKTKESANKIIDGWFKEK